MQKISLNGAWRLRAADAETEYPASVPGCNFIDLQAAGAIPDPLIGMNENEVQWVATKDWIYERTFDAPAWTGKCELVFDMLDTLCEISLNGDYLGSADNINRIYRFDVTGKLCAGENRLTLLFRSPLPVIAEKNKKNPLPNSTMGEAGSCQIRKTPYHFGWDWGPHLIPAGISGDVTLVLSEGYVWDDVRLRQTHTDGKVVLSAQGTLAQAAEKAEQARCRYILTYEGETIAESEGTSAELTVDHPQLWWCNGLGGQPLYRLRCEVRTGDRLTDERTLTVGLRTLELSTAADAYGKDFCFVVNGTRIFARGANWIASDSFINKTTPQKLEELIVKAKKANFNMLRVWGGAYYESDLFYELCAKYGILVWQDCNFACSPYPFNEAAFVENVRAEIADNVKRLRHQPALCLWCGNNEIESMSLAWAYRRDVIKQTGKFFYETLRGWIEELDGVTPYWACTPSSGTYMNKINHDDYGDTHLWHVWHGLRPLEFYRKRMTRFCSEFGIESLPSLNALEIFAGEEATDFSRPVMKLHQKCAGGNGKMLFYVLSRYWEPAAFRDMVYMTQIAQMECVREATEHWRRNKGRCNGSLYWQYNDCWGVSSWSGMDYYGNLKAVQYMAAHFDSPVTVTVENTEAYAKIFVHNDVNEPLAGTLEYGVMTFGGDLVWAKETPCDFRPQQTAQLAEADLRSVKPYRRADCFFYAHLIRDGKIVSTRTFPILREKKSRLPAAKIERRVETVGGMATIALQSPQYARYVELRLKGVAEPFDDNFFDLMPGKPKTVRVALPEGMSAAEAEKLLEIKSIADVAPKRSRLGDKFKYASIFLRPVNFVNWIARTFDN